MTIHKVLLTFALCLPVSFASVPAYAGPIYSVNRTIGVGTVVGTIETDGTLGFLSTAQILDWNLTLNDGAGSFTLLGPLSGSNSARLVREQNLFGTPTNLLFNFSAVGGLWFQNPGIGSGMNTWCVDGLLSPPHCLGLMVESVGTIFQNFVQVPRTGLVSIADIDLAAIPEPTTLLLFGTTAAGLGLARWRQRKRQQQQRQ